MPSRYVLIALLCHTLCAPLLRILLHLRDRPRGRTVSWLRNGSRLHTFHSSLPGGSPRTAAAAGPGGGGGGASALYGGGSAAASTSDYCLLDCVYYKPTSTYYVQVCLS